MPSSERREPPKVNYVELFEEMQAQPIRSTAQFDKRCAGCTEMIVEGDVIVKLPGDDEWVCAECGLGA
jgi:rRNA maturation endonuclease Nob1